MAGPARDSKGFEELSYLSKCVIPLDSPRPRALNFLCSVLLPLTVLTYGLLNLTGTVLQLPQWRIQLRDGSGNPVVPCFQRTVGDGGALNRAQRGASMAATGVAVAGVVASIGLVLFCSLGRAVLSFTRFWGMRNYGLLYWSLARGVLLGVVDGAGSAGLAVLVILNVPIFSACDLLILKSRGRWAQGGCWLFFLVNCLSSTLN